VIQLSDSTYFSFQGVHLDLDTGTRLRSFNLGEGFASIRPPSISFITDHFTEASEPGQVEGNAKVAGKAITDHHCAVCDGAIHDAKYSLTLSGTRIQPCGPNCHESFLGEVRREGEAD
jgi:hypothetical protein